MFAICCCLFSSITAHAQHGDGLYARWDYDLAVMTEVGAGGARWDDDWSLTLNGGVHALFFGVGGPMVAARWADGAVPEHLIVGVDVRPLFPALFFLYKPTWHEFWDLFIQSFSIELGAAFVFADTTDVGFSAGFAFEVPLFRRDAHRVALRAATRRIKAPASFLGVNRTATEWSVRGGLVWYVGTDIGAARWEAPRYRVR